ncbi:GNAT family N-acetyltransferase [Aliarcobacter butzleri]|uniref:GNAT family N-acetyltransferase n=1 Tax=Aliarcobacter butzleri TaxID=28197 RepID=UPI001EDB1F93|nr:GNAT family N-acetyltransferase [Aliarcobacter butzleri]MCG3677409.1 GNAT family N-acetyltransferase [Aliarcobacter butzleri]
MYDIRLASEQDLMFISKIHKSSYSKIHFTSYFSLDLTEKYYSYFINNKDSKIFVLTKNKKILGFVVCGENISKQLTLFKREQRLQILKTVIINPYIVFKKVIINIFNKLFDSQINYRETNFLILSIVSSGEEKGLGSLLLEYVKKYGLKNDINKIGLYVRISNISAINAYLKNGYKIVGYTSGQYYMEQNNL